LCDERGLVLWPDFLESEDPDAPAARAIVRTRMRKLARTAEPSVRRNSRQILSWVLIPASVVSIGSIIFYPAAFRLLVNAAVDPSSRPWLRALAIAGVTFLSAATISPVYLFAASELDAEANRRWKPDRYPELTEFLAIRMGRLEVVPMEPGMWYRYVSPEGLRRNSGITDNVAGFSFIGLLCLALALWMRITDDTVSALGFGIFAILPIGAAFAYYRFGQQLLSPLPERFRRLSDGSYEIAFEDDTATCRPVRLPKRTRILNPQFGALCLVLRSDGDRTYRIDPRYLVPDESPPAT
jgi:hypothetical protein